MTPLHGSECSDSHTEIQRTPQVGRNQPCPCGSRKKFKNCCRRKKHHFAGILGKEQFAQHLATAIRKAGGDVDYDRDRFCLSQEGELVLHLGNAYHEYRSAPESCRDEVLKSWTSAWFLSQRKFPELYEDAAYDILPAVRELDYCTTLCAGIHAYRPLTDHHAVHLVYDWPQAMMDISQECLGKWGVDFTEAYEKALENLRRIDSSPGFTRQIRGLYVSTFNDNYDTSRILLPEIVSALELQGDPVVLLPNRTTLLVAGADDADGLAAMAESAMAIADKPRFRSGIPLRFIDGGLGGIPSRGRQSVGATIPRTTAAYHCAGLRTAKGNAGRA